MDTVKVGLFTFWLRLKLSASFLVWRSACYRSVSMLNLSPWGRFRATWLRGGNFLDFFFSLSLPQPQNVLADSPGTQGHGWHLVSQQGAYLLHCSHSDGCVCVLHTLRFVTRSCNCGCFQGQEFKRGCVMNELCPRRSILDVHAGCTWQVGGSSGEGLKLLPTGRRGWIVIFVLRQSFVPF